MTPTIDRVVWRVVGVVYAIDVAIHWVLARLVDVADEVRRRRPL